MIFTSVAFLIFFIVILGLVQISNNERTKVWILLLGSYFFYGWWNPLFVLLIVASSLWGWYLGLLIHRSDEEKLKTRYMRISLLLSLGVLAYYKYAEFLLAAIYSSFGLDWSYDLGIILPVGISFFTFQTMSYTIDLKRGDIEVCHSLPKFMLFVAFFPQLVAGPIVRASDFLPQLNRPIILSKKNLLIGSQLFLGGALQKVLLADNMAVFVDPVFADPALYNTATLWLALGAYSVQIFCDFCGYSLMAIGIARILGFELPENFRMPYLSKSITEFWRRWHISLSSWLRDYLYISLGGNRNGPARTYLHLSITMLLGGLWHGASWNFILWGALHGIALAIHKYWESRTTAMSGLKNSPVYKTGACLTTLFFCVLLWVPFRCVDSATMLAYVKGLFVSQNGIEWLNPHILLVLGIVLIWHLLYELRPKLLGRYPTVALGQFSTQFVIGLSLLAILMFAPLNSSPFVYFQF